MLAEWSHIELSFPDKQVLKDVSLAIHQGEKIALVGENGAGKSCLFRLMLGEMKPDRGDVRLANGVRIGYLDQVPFWEQGDSLSLTCIQVAEAPFDPLIRMEQRIEDLGRALASTGADHHDLLSELGEIQSTYELGGGFTYRTRMEATLTGLGLLQETWDRPVTSLSAGQKVRLALANILLQDVDLLLLDEPTNHLDLDAREWLAAYLAKLETAYIVISHDRVFLDRTTTKTAQLDRGTLRLYTGNYSAFRDRLETDTASAWRTYDKRQSQIRKLEEQAKTYRNWSGARERDKRGAGDKGYVGHKAAKLMKRALVAERRLKQRIEELKTEKPFEKDPLKIEFEGVKGRHLLSVSDLVVGYDLENPLTKAMTFSLLGGDRLAILGPNGCGKTTLLRTLLGEVQVLAGEYRFAGSAKIGYFDQENKQLDPDETALEAVLSTGRDETIVRTVMGRMRISKDSVHKAVTTLSAGERAKVLLARLMLSELDLLILDEPTNHLDIETQDTLLDALSGFPGGIMFISHDRYFVDTLATMHLDLSGVQVQ